MTMKEAYADMFASKCGKDAVLGLFGMKLLSSKIEEEIENFDMQFSDALSATMTIAHLNNVRKKVMLEACNCLPPSLPFLEEFKELLKENHKAIYNQYGSLLSNQL